MKKTLVLALGIAAACAHAQLNIYGTQVVDTGSNISTYSGTYSLTNPSSNNYLGFVDDIWTHRAVSEDTSVTFERDVYMYFSTNNIPTLLSNMTSHFGGKAVWSGGNPETVLDADFRAGAFLLEYQDTNGNHMLDTGETGSFVNSTPILSLANLDHNSLAYYTVDADFTNPDYILNPNTDYVLLIASGVFADNITVPTGTSVGLTLEHNVGPFDGHFVTFDATPVPEPATLTLLALPALAALKRRKR